MRLLVLRHLARFKTQFNRPFSVAEIILGAGSKYPRKVVQNMVIFRLLLKTLFVAVDRSLMIPRDQHRVGLATLGKEVIGFVFQNSGVDLDRFVGAFSSVVHHGEL